MTDTDFLTSHGFSQEQAEALQTWAAAREATFNQRFDTLQTTLNRVALGMEGVARDVARGFAGMGAQIDGVHTRLGRVEDRLGRVEDRLGRVEDRLDRIEGQFQAPPEAL